LRLSSRGESFGDNRQLELKIAPASLQDALAQLADLTGLQILYDPPLVRGRVSRGLEGRNEGLELDLHGEVLPGVSLLASGALIESRIIGANENYYVSSDGTYSPTAAIEVVGASDKQLSGVPRFGGSLWATYAPPFAGVKLGLGAVARTERMGDNANDYQLPGFVRWNALAAYSWPVGETRFSLQLNIENLFNARYFESVSSTYVVMPGAPRRWSGVIRAEF
jgi:iron complex outermembrane receptor protein